MQLKVTFLGHSTVLVELDGERLLTDPILRSRVLHLRRRGEPVTAGQLGSLTGVLISHMHPDHFDPGSLRLLDRETPLIVPSGASGAARAAGFDRVSELAAGQGMRLGSLELSATPARHDGRRYPFGPPRPAIGFKIEGTQSVYFAGDTDLFGAMSELAPLDLALLPIWGWGARLGSGHLDPHSAAEALDLLRPRIAIPIHWGTLHPIGMRRRVRTRMLHDPPHDFARAAAEQAPAVEVRVLAPGESAEL